MKLLTLFRKIAPSPEREEPVGKFVRVNDANNATHTRDNVIYDLFAEPGRLRAQLNGIAEEAKRADHDQLMTGLFAQYCQALVSPQAIPSASWHRAASGVPASQLSISSDGLPDSCGEAAQGAIADVLGDINRVDEAFGSLRRAQDADPLVLDAVPEVLHLFAPEEFRQRKPRSTAAIPPALAQREHHTLSIDSPLTALDTKSTDVVQGTE